MRLVSRRLRRDLVLRAAGGWRLVTSLAPPSAMTSVKVRSWNASMPGRWAIEINVVDPIVRKGFRFKGTARVLDTGPLFSEILDFFQRERGTEIARVQSVVLMEIVQARPLTSPAYDGGASEQEISARWTRYFAGLRGEEKAEAVSD